MFAKLKKRIQDEGGTVSDGEKSFSSPSSSHSTQRRNSGMSDTGQESANEETSSMVASPGGKNDVSDLLVKRTEQCRKLETKISEYAAVIKDKNKTIEKLELHLEKQQDLSAKKCEELNEQYQLSRVKLLEDHKAALLMKEKEKEKLLEELKKAEEFKNKYFKKEEESDEFEGLTTQEIAKVKHMLLMAQEELSKCRTELASSTEQLTAANQKSHDMTNDLEVLREKQSNIEKESLRLKEENEELSRLVKGLTNEKSVFEKRLDELNIELTSKSSQLSKTCGDLTELENEYKTYQRNSDHLKNKSSKLIEEKDDHIKELQDRIKMVEQRLQVQDLSGDDRLLALETERDGLELKLSETRQQLTEIKSTWSDKITHLEEQISHLNAKIIEDNEEMISKDKMADSMRENFHKQMENLRGKLEDAEKRALENYELVQQKEQLYEKQKDEKEAELNKSRLQMVDMETHLRGKITLLESQSLEVETSSKTEISELNHKLNKLTEKEDIYLTNQLKADEDIRSLEADVTKLQKEISELTDERSRVKQIVEEKTKKEQDLVQKCCVLEEQMISLQDEIKSIEYIKQQTEIRLLDSDKDKGELMLRNAELSQQLEKQRRLTVEKQNELASELDNKQTEVDDLNQHNLQLQQQINKHENKLKDLESVKSQSAVDLGRANDLEKVVTDLQDQLTDKNRALKKQEQTLKDLRQTLQRELKVQSLPNDDSDRSRGNSPLPVRKNNKPAQIEVKPMPPVSASKSSCQQPSHMPPPSGILMSQEDFDRVGAFTGYVKDKTPGFPEREVNLQYLKHVVLKFMLSRESEAIQLVKAISVLLHFSTEEQRLVQQTLDWKMSWFGAKPAAGKGQLSKIIPPSY
ncbi:golgin subfamily A member 1 [Patella vulgata]|uniref:golgin subfamily A member 1 n=1 Tax=Patella vulgata TaxID=6465 RepID=UPI00217F34CF|nr:golgin subfamily A member 1 [Patella vulgata]